MADAHEPANLRPEDAPSVVEPFDVATTAEGEENGREDDLDDDLENDLEDESEDEPQPARPPQAWPAGGQGAPPRGPGGGGAGPARPRSQKAQYEAAVERIYRKVYEVHASQAGEPVRPGYYKWWINEYVREEGQYPRRRVIIEGGIRRIVVLFDRVASKKEIRRWIAEKILHQREEGPAPKDPMDRRSWYLRDSKGMLAYDKAVASCSIV